MAGALAMLDSAWGFLTGLDKVGLPAAALGDLLRALERGDARAAAVRGQTLAAFAAQDGAVADGQQTNRLWLINTTEVTKGQAAEHLAVQKLAERHPVLLAGLAGGDALTRSVALQLAKWVRKIPQDHRDAAEQILVAAAEAGADLRALAAIYGEILSRTAPADPDDPDPGPDRGVWLETTMDGAGLLRGELSPDCAAMVGSVLDALSVPEPGGESRTQRERYHDALAEAFRRLLASDLLPKRAGQPLKALGHIHFTELRALDGGSVLQDRWITDYRARWAARRAAASVSPGDGGAWLEGEAARRFAADAMIIPVVTADIDPGAIELLITACAQYHAIRTQATAEDPAGQHDMAGQQDAAAAAPPAGTTAEVLAMLEHQILAAVIQVVSGPGGVASFLRRNLMGKGLNGPSLPLDVGATDEIPVHLRRLVALRDQTCRHPGGCEQPAARCEPHHVVHRADGGHTSLTGLQEWCWWHHHVLLHQLGWKLTVHPDGTSKIASPEGKTIHSHSPPPRPGLATPRCRCRCCSGQAGGQWDRLSTCADIAVFAAWADAVIHVCGQDAATVGNRVASAAAHVPSGFLVQSLLICWYARCARNPADIGRCRLWAWYRANTAPSAADTLARMRRESPKTRFSAIRPGPGRTRSNQIKPKAWACDTTGRVIPPGRLSRPAPSRCSRSRPPRLSPARGSASGRRPGLSRAVPTLRPRAAVASRRAGSAACADRRGQAPDRPPVAPAPA